MRFFPYLQWEFPAAVPRATSHVGSRVGDLWDWDQDQDQYQDCGCAGSRAGLSSLQQAALGHRGFGDGSRARGAPPRADCGSVRARLAAWPGAGCGPAAVLCACRGLHAVPCPVLLVLVLVLVLVFNPSTHRAAGPATLESHLALQHQHGAFYQWLICDVPLAFVAPGNG